ncbi:MAG: manganese-dependent inorganic pyrophosphatase [Archaeoglobaceae archaeon]
MAQIYVVGHKNPDTDTVCSAIAFAYLWNKWKETGAMSKVMKIEDEAIPAVQGELNAETKFVLEKFKIAPPQKLTDASGKKIALVDHSEKAQSLENIDKAEIVAIVDHHKIGDITTPNPILFLNLPAGSTATVLKILFDKTGISIPKDLAGIMLASILSDTVIFKSATTTELDKKVAEELAKIAEITDLVKFGVEVKGKLSEVHGMSAKDIVMRDFKDFIMAGKKVGIGQIELLDLSLIENRKDEIYNELVKKKAEGYHSVFLMLTDIMKEGTELLVVTDDPKIVEKAFGKKLEGRSIWLDKVMSRKKQVVPPLEKAFS